MNKNAKRLGKSTEMRRIYAVQFEIVRKFNQIRAQVLWTTTRTTTTNDYYGYEYYVSYYHSTYTVIFITISTIVVYVPPSVYSYNNINISQFIHFEQPKPYQTIY